MRINTRLDHLKQIVAKWRRLPGVNKQVIALSVIEQMNRHNFKEALSQVGIAFTDSGNVFNDAQRNAEKIFRWLGEMDIAEQPGKLFYVEELIVSALPEELRTEYLNSVYSKSGVYISNPEKQACGLIDVTVIVSALIKENSEAQIAVHQLAQSSTLKQLKAAERELRESISITQAALDGVKAKIKQFESGDISQLKAV